MQISILEHLPLDLKNKSLPNNIMNSSIANDGRVQIEQVML